MTYNWMKLTLFVAHQFAVVWCSASKYVLMTLSLYSLAILSEQDSHRYSIIYFDSCFNSMVIMV